MKASSFLYIGQTAWQFSIIIMEILELKEYLKVLLPNPHVISQVKPKDI